MRSILASVCALLLLSGCGRTHSESPTTSINPPPGGTASQPRKKTSTTTSTQPTPDKKTNIAVARQETPPVPNGPTFSATDPRQTLAWLIQGASRVRATPSGDQAGLEQNWQEFTRTLESAAGRKIRWELPVRTVAVKNKRTDGVVTATVKSDAEPACTGLRLQPEHQPTGYKTFILKLPAGNSPPALRSGSRVLVSGTIAHIDTNLRKSRPGAADYGFNIRLSDYAVTPVD